MSESYKNQNNEQKEEIIAKPEEEIETCMVCFDSKQNCIFQPCGHSGLEKI